MSDQYINYGIPLSSIDPELLTHQESQSLFAVCQAQPYIDIIELRSVQREQTVEDVIIVDFGDGSVPSRNSIGINVRERLALSYRPTTNSNLCPYDVRAIRSNFPVTPHQNQVLQGEPASLCLYFEPWSTLERSWTPQSHLKRIHWWLRETAQGTLHREDQPLEQLYFVSQWKIILPPDFHERVEKSDDSLVLSRLSPVEDASEIIINGRFSQEKTEKNPIQCLSVPLPPVKTGMVETFPYNLGELHEQLASKGISLFDQLSSTITNRASSSELTVTPVDIQPLTFILLSIPRVRETNNPIEHYDLQGFVIPADIAQIGISMDILFKDPESAKAYLNTSICAETDNHQESKEEWKKIEILPVDVKLRTSRNRAREASGIAKSYSDFNGILAGVGALGSCLAEIWSKEAWGNWTYVDDDILEPHNTIRHIGKNDDIGHPKVEVVKYLTDQNYAEELHNSHAIRAKINDSDNTDVQTAINQSNLLVDITTTLEAPRDVSMQQESPRMVSAFVTPSGNDSVMLFEDKERLIRLPSLEAQYYRAILQEGWGDTHLVGHSGNLWVGAGCRDTSTIMSNEFIQLHGAVLARQIRKHSNKPDAKICIWTNDDETGCIKAIDIPVYPTVTNHTGDWSICCDMGLQKKLINMRKEGLPNETGGILLGYLDQKMKTIHLVDALPAPPDSISEPSGFVRGTNGVKDKLNKSEAKTAGIVTYIGEWHSHPPSASVIPSHLDIELLADLSEQMATDGLPFLMVIIGKTEISFTLG